MLLACAVIVDVFVLGFSVQISSA